MASLLPNISLPDDDKTIKEYEKKLSSIKSDDVEGHYKLGLWCEGKKLDDLAKKEFERTISINLNHKGAREKLGYINKNGKWVPKDYDKFVKAAKDGIHIPDDSKLDAVASSTNAKEAIEWIKNRENWTTVLLHLYDKLGLFFEDLDVKISVSSANKGGWGGQGGGVKGKGSLEIWLGSSGNNTIDGLRHSIIHEMTHVYFSGFGPSWMNEGLAKYVEDSPDGIMYFILTKTEPKKAGEAYPHYEANYGRGYLFWTYINQQFGAQTVKDFAKNRVNGSDYKEAIQKATSVEWEKLINDELEWTKSNWKNVAKKNGMPVK